MSAETLGEFRYWYTPIRYSANEPRWLSDVSVYHIRIEVFKNWPTVTAIGMVISVRHQGDEVTEEVRYYILSEYLDGREFAQAVRQHWSVENNYH